MKRERRFEWWGKTILLGAGSALAVGLGGGMLSPALAQTGSAASVSLLPACPPCKHWSATRSTVQTPLVRVR